jgi:hypothetical protein
MWGLGCLVWESFNGPLKARGNLKDLEHVSGTAGRGVSPETDDLLSFRFQSHSLRFTASLLARTLLTDPT